MSDADGRIFKQGDQLVFNTIWQRVREFLSLNRRTQVNDAGNMILLAQLFALFRSKRAEFAATQIEAMRSLALNVL